MRFAVLLASLVFASSSMAQVIYQPVQYQYGSEDTKFYYGGSDPYVFRVGAYYGLKPINSEPLRVYTDLMPGRNAAIYGYTPDDARNEAYDSVPRYFRKRDLFDGAIPVNGAVVVPARSPDAGTIEIKPYVRPLRKSYDPVIVIPKSMLNKTLPGAPKA